MEGARIIFPNFSGKEGKFNPPGNRNFCVCLDDDLAQVLKKDGWNVRYLKPRDEEDPPQAYLQVRVMFGQIPPKIVMISSAGKTIIGEDEVNILDWAEFQKIDLVIRPYEWEVNDKRGVKAYLKTMYATIIEDEFADNYVDVPDSAKASIGHEPLPFE